MVESDVSMTLKQNTRLQEYMKCPENSKRAHLSAPALQTPPKFQQEREKRMKTVAGEKARNFGPSTLWPSTLRPSTLRGPRSGPQASGPLFFKVWASTLRGPTCGPRIQHPKIGRSRNWRSPKLAEVDRAQRDLSS